MPEGGNYEDSDTETTKVLVAELQRLYGRMENANDGTTTVIQFIVLVFGAAAIVADKVPEAVVAMPIFWTVWLLYAILTDSNTRKYAAAARRLERAANDRLGIDVFVWETEMAKRGNRYPVIFLANYGYWLLLNAASWILGIMVLRHEDQRGWIWVLIAVWAATWLAGAYASIYRRAKDGNLEDSLPPVIRPPTTKPSSSSTPPSGMV